MNLITIYINGIRTKVPNGISIYNACYLNNIQLPRFCYHETLAVAGNCRTCYVEIKNSPKLVVACAILVNENMSIFTDTEFVKQGRINSIELILKNHPLDCPVCDQGGSCDLQEQSYIYGSDRSHFFGKKRANHKILLSNQIKTQMNRCITCTRCVRFINTILSNNDLNTYGRGEDTIISHIRTIKNHPHINHVATLCPVGALTLNQSAFNGRPWQRTIFNYLKTNNPTTITIANYGGTFLINPHNKSNINNQSHIRWSALITRQLY